MDGEELGGTFVISVDELGLNGLWSTIKDLVESRMPLQGLTLPNKVGKIVAVPRLPLMFVLSTDKRLLRLKQYSHSPVTWFRNPHTHLILVSTADVHEYKSTTRAQLKRVTADVEKDWGGAAVGSEWLILYVRPFELEPSDRGTKKVFEKLCDDFASKRRERVVRLDVPLRAFDSPAAAGGSSGGRITGGGYSPVPTTAAGAGSQGLGGFGGGQGSAVWGFGATGLDELTAGLRDSIRCAFEARQAAYDAEVRRLLNERREPKWSFTTLYLVKDSFALMLEGAGLWEDAFQEYVELETVYLDCLETTAAAAAAASAAEAAAAAVRDAADFGLTGSDTEDVASILSSSWRNMRRLVLWKKSVQEFHFRQYLFAAQARVLLRLGRPVDVAERGLVFIQNFLAILAAREAAGQIKPWFKECWAFSACMSLITAITAYTAQQHTLPPDWDVTDLLTAGSGPQGTAAAAAMRQLAAVAAAERAEKVAAAAGIDARGSSTRRSTEGDRIIRASRVSHIPGSPPPPLNISTPASSSSSTAPSGSSSSGPVLTAGEWELEFPKEVLRGAAAAAAAVDHHHDVGDDDEENVPPLDMAVLCGQAITPGNAGLLLAGEQRKELTDKLYNCLLGHLYHLARGELLRLGSALRLPEAAAAAAAAGGAAGASILQLGRSPFAPAAAAAAAAIDRSSVSVSKSKVGHTAAAAAAGSGRPRLSSGVDLVAAAAAAGTMGPQIVAQLQDLLLMPLCGFSQMINKYADGSGEGLTYEVHTPKFGSEEDPLAAALTRHDSQSTASGFLNTLTNTPLGGSSSSSSNAHANANAQHSPTTAAAAAAAGSSTMFDRLRRGGSSSGSSTVPTAVQQQQQQQQVQSRLSKASAEDQNGIPAAAAAGAGAGLVRADSSTSLATVNITSAADTQTPAAAAAANQTAAADSSTADSASSLAAAAAGGDRGGGGSSGVGSSAAAAAAAAVPSLTANAGSLSGASGQGLRDIAALPKIATHVRSVSALPATAAAAAGGSSGSTAAAAAAAAGTQGAIISPRRLEGLVDASATVPSGSAVLQRAAAAATGGLSLVHPAAAAAAAAAVPSWVGEWRLQLALRNAAAFQELLLGLSRCAARCYARAGRVRSSALIYADVAVMALQRGHLDQAARLLTRMQQIFTSEGWPHLLGALLPKLLAVQRLAAQPLLPFTALALLSLPCGAAAAADRQAAFEELLAAIGASSQIDQFGDHGATMIHHQQQQQQQQQQYVQLATHAALQLQPAAGTYSHFFGSEEPEGLAMQGLANPQQQQQQQLRSPVLSPPAQPYPPPPPAAAAPGVTPAAAAAAGDESSRCGAALIAVGDSLLLTVDVVSQLPGPVQLRHLALSLVQLLKSTWLSSTGGNSIFSSTADMSLSGAAGSSGVNLLALEQGLGAAGGVRDSQGFSSSRAAAAAAAAGLGFTGGGNNGLGGADSPSTAVQRWQEGDELVSRKLVAAYSPVGASDTTAAAAAAAAGSSQLLSDGSVVLVPGLNRLVFQVAPVKEGLYCLKQLRAVLGTSAELLIGLPAPESLSLLAAAAAAGAVAEGSNQQKQKQRQRRRADQICTAADAVLSSGPSSTGTTAEAVQIGGVTAAGAVVSEVVVARVIGPAPRLRLTPVLPGGGLPVGCTAWLGVLLCPLHDVTLRRPRLHVLPSKLLSFAATVGHRVSAGDSFQQGLGALGSSSAGIVTQQQQQQQAGIDDALPSSTSVLSSSTTLSYSGTAGMQGPHSQAVHWIYVTQLPQQPKPPYAAAAAAGSSSNEAAAAAAGRWLRVARGGCIDLSEVSGPDGELNSPLLLWMQVLVGSPSFPPATVKVAAAAAQQIVTPAAAAAGLSSRHSGAADALQQQQQQQQGSSPRKQPAAVATTPAAAAAAASIPKCIPEPCVLLASRPIDVAAELAMQVEYTAGVWRSHACCLQLPLQQPAAVIARAVQLPNGTTALSFTITIDHSAGYSLLLMEAGLRPQYGLVLSGGSSSSSSGGEGLGGVSHQGFGGPGFDDVLPVRVLPGGSAGLCYTLNRDPGDKSTGSFEADGSSLLVLSYCLEPAHKQAEITDPVTGNPLPPPPAAAVQYSSAADGLLSSDAGSSSALGVQQPPAAAAAASASAVAAGQVMSLRLPFWLEFSSDSPAAVAGLKATLLGPFSGRVGQPMILTWQLARTGLNEGLGPSGDDSVTDNVTNSFSGFSSISLSEGVGASVSVRFSGDQDSEGLSTVQHGDYDEVLLYDVTPGFSKTLGLSPGSHGDLLRSSFQQGSVVPRAGGGSVGQGLNRAHQTINPAEGSPWWLGCNPTGSVRLGRAAGSLATVEVVLVPHSAGRQVVPQLVLRSFGGNQPLLMEGEVSGGEDEPVLHIQP